jgi:hypothetical protein
MVRTDAQDVELRVASSKLSKLGQHLLGQDWMHFLYGGLS